MAATPAIGLQKLFEAEVNQGRGLSESSPGDDADVVESAPVSLLLLQMSKGSGPANNSMSLVWPDKSIGCWVLCPSECSMNKNQKYTVLHYKIKF